MKKQVLKKYLAFLALIIPLFIYSPSFAKERGFSIQSANIEKQGALWLLQVTFDYPFSEPVIEALNNGIPITISTQLEIKETTAWPWTKTVFKQAFSFQIRYHGLAKLYQVTDITEQKRYHFASFEAAIEHLQNLKSFPLALHHIFKFSPKHFGELQTTLEIEALPLPLRPVAYLAPQWHLKSEWFKWSLQS